MVPPFVGTNPRPENAPGRGVAAIGGGAWFRCGSRPRFVRAGFVGLALTRWDRDVALRGPRLFRGGRRHLNPAFTAVVTDSVHGDVIDHGLVVDIGDVRGGYIVHCAVVVQTAALPVAAFVAPANVTVAVIDPAVEPNVRPPVAEMPHKAAPSLPPTPGRQHTPH